MAQNGTKWQKLIKFGKTIGKQIVKFVKKLAKSWQKWQIYGKYMAKVDKSWQKMANIWQKLIKLAKCCIVSNGSNIGASQCEQLIAPICYRLH